MELEIKHTVSLSRETIDLLNGILAHAEKSNGAAPAEEKATRRKKEAPEVAVAPGPAVAAKPAITLEQVREAGMKKSQEGFRDEVKAILKTLGAAKTTELKEDQYQEFLDRINAIV